MDVPSFWDIAIQGLERRDRALGFVRNKEACHIGIAQGLYWDYEGIILPHPLQTTQ